ncbi:hypothetical protein K8R47_01125 [archaeon]|nr:hypothetical protein [archaeon]
MAKLAIETIISVILVILVIVVIIVFLPGNLWALAKDALGFGDEIINFGEINNKSLVGFNILVDKIEDCKLTKTKVCGCDLDFSHYYKTHELQVSENEIKLVNLKEENEVTMSKEDISGLNCYFKGNNVNSLVSKTMNPLNILFYKGDKQSYYIEDEGIFDKSLDFVHRFELINNKGNVCFLTDEVKDIKDLTVC